jgi:hypothetical protein
LSIATARISVVPDPLSVVPDPLSVVPNPLSVAPDPLPVAPDPLPVAPAPLFAAPFPLVAPHYPLFGAPKGKFGGKIEWEEQTNKWLNLIPTTNLRKGQQNRGFEKIRRKICGHTDTAIAAPERRCDALRRREAGRCKKSLRGLLLFTCEYLRHLQTKFVKGIIPDFFNLPLIFDKLGRFFAKCPRLMNPSP